MWSFLFVTIGLFPVEVTSKSLHSSRGCENYADNHISRETAVNVPSKIQMMTIQRPKRLFLLEKTRESTGELILGLA